MLRQRILDKVRDAAMQDQKHEATEGIIAANNQRDDGHFREQKKQAFMQQAMQYMDNPIFKRQMFTDLKQQEKYFQNEPPPIPHDWIKEGHTLS